LTTAFFDDGVLRALCGLRCESKNASGKGNCRKSRHDFSEPDVRKASAYPHPTMNISSQKIVHSHSASPEIAGSNDGRSVDDGTDKRPHPFVFDVFAEDDEG
jgi:hypothetical protein